MNSDLIIFVCVFTVTNNTIAKELLLCYFSGMKGNLTERRLACFISIAMGITSIGGGLYFVLWQTYVLMLEAILFIIHMALVVLETIFGLVTFFAIQKSLGP